MSRLTGLTNAELIEELRELDQREDIDVSRWEATFMESMFASHKFAALTPNERAKTIEIIEKYE